MMEDSNVIAQTQLEKVWVSTVELKELTRLLDNIIEVFAPFDMKDRPGLQTKASEFVYETMVFPSDDGDGPSNFEELDCERYNSLDDANVGHARMVEKWKQHD
jgi:hypothetical protein